MRQTGSVALGDAGAPWQDLGSFGIAGAMLVVELSDLAVQAFRWTAATGMAGLGDLPGGAFASRARAVSADGSVVVGEGSSAGSGPTFREAFRWTQAGGMAGLGDFPGDNFSSAAASVSADGSVVVGFGDPANPVEDQAFRWTAAAGLVGLGDLPGGLIDSTAQAVSANGLVVVGQSNSALGAEAFRWTAATGMVALGDLPGGFFNSAALAVSADGSVVVGWGNTGGAVLEEAFIWDSVNGMRNLRDVLIAQGDDLTGWTLEHATGISADGRTISGWGRNPSGQVEAWVTTLGPAKVVPEPSALALAVLGTLGVFGYARRTRRTSASRGTGNG